jgi:hypothetical protein
MMAVTGGHIVGRISGDGVAISEAFGGLVVVSGEVRSTGHPPA